MPDKSDRWNLTVEPLDDGRYRVVLDERLAAPYGGWNVTAAFVTNATMNDAKLVRLVVRHDDGDDAPQMTARLLRAIRPERLRLRATAETAMTRIRELTKPGATAREQRQALERKQPLGSIGQALQSRSAKRTGRPAQHSDADLARLAQRYLELVAAKDDAPVKTLAAELGYSASTVRGRLNTARSRERGLLESEGQGKPGGKLSAKARSAIRKGT